MKTQKLFVILAVAVFALAFAKPLVAADIKDKTTNITIRISTGPVTGNMGVDNQATDLQDGTIVPNATSTDNVINNRVIIHSGGTVVDNTVGGLSYGSGNVSDNRVSIYSGGTAIRTVSGGFSFGSGKVSGNIVTVNGSATQATGGISTGSGDISDNKVIIYSFIEGLACGGSAEGGSGNVMGNNVTIAANGSALQATGGRVENSQSLGSVSSNTVEVIGKVRGIVYGGYTTNFGAVFNNTVNISGEAERGAAGNLSNTASSAAVSGNNIIVSGTIGEARGGYSNGIGAITNNTATISGKATTVYGSIGRNIDNPSSNSGNTVTVSGVVSEMAVGAMNEGRGEVRNNSVTITSSGTTNLALGGYALGRSDVIANRVDISGTANQNVYGGYSTGSGNVTANRADVSGTAKQTVYGGRINNANSSGVISNNIVTISGTANSVYGGISNGLGSVTGNSVNLSGTANQDVYGGQVTNADNPGAVSNNIVIVGGTVASVYGGSSAGKGDVTSNSVNLSGTANQDVYGGRIANTASSGVVSGNIVSFDGTGGSVYGGSSAGNGNVTENHVNARGTADSVYGGSSAGKGNVTNNNINLSGTANQEVYAGRITNTDSLGAVSDNQVSIEGTAGSVYGGSSAGNGNITHNFVLIRGTANSVYGGISNGLGSVTGNYVDLRGTANQEVYGGQVTNADNSGAVSNNSVIISGTANQEVYGGSSAGKGDVTRNSVNLSGTANSVYGGISNGLGNVTGNYVDLSGTANQDVYGGRIENTASSGTVSGNALNISGTVNNAAYAGYTNGTGTVDNNAVYIARTANLAKAYLYGFNTGAAGSGNRLDVNGFSGNVTGIANFDTYNFVLGKLAPNQTFINIIGNDPVIIDGSVISIDFAPEFHGTVKTVGEEITIISKINSGATPATVTVAPSPFIAYDFIERHDENRLVLTLADIRPTRQTVAIAQGFVAGLAFLGQAADLRSNIHAQAAYLASSIYYVPQGQRFIPFAKMIYGSQYISSGSSIKVKGFSSLAGLAYSTDFENGHQLIVGVFVESGWGDYNSRNSFSNSAAIKSKGDTEYFGGGVLARYALKSGLYGEGTFAAGKTETDFMSRDFIADTRTKYDYSVPYYSAHVAVGQILQLNDMLNLDVYSKYLWTKQKGENLTINGYRFKFKDADSHRLWVGARLNADISAQLHPYVGMTYEYEFSGKIKGSLYGMNLKEPSLRGSTGIGELGLVWTPKDAQNLRVDLGLQAYAGKREGVSGELSVSLSF